MSVGFESEEVGLQKLRERLQVIIEERKHVIQRASCGTSSFRRVTDYSLRVVIWSQKEEK